VVREGDVGVAKEGARCPREQRNRSLEVRDQEPARLTGFEKEWVARPFAGYDPVVPVENDNL